MSESKSLKNVRTAAAPEVDNVSDKSVAKPSGSTLEVVDARGRKIIVKKLNALEKMRLSKAMGSDGATNLAYATYATMAASVVSIDGEAEAFPMTARAIEALVAQLDDDGLEAVREGVYELNGIENIDETVDRAK